MPSPDERVALVALLRQPGAVLGGSSAMDRLRRHFGVGETLFPDQTALDDALASAAALVREWVSSGIGIHALPDPSYPPRLRDIPQAPPLLFSRGIVADDHRAIAVVGTRQPTERGLRIAAGIARVLAGNAITVVSGLAAGIDTTAHTAALRAGGRTVAVIGTGVDRHYPSANRGLQQRIAAEGLVVSQFWPDAEPSRTSFPMRNAVMSGYAAATVVAEAPYRSGARMQARLALEQGRPVILPDKLLAEEWARDYATRPGVHVVHDPDELVAVANELIQ